MKLLLLIFLSKETGLDKNSSVSISANKRIVLFNAFAKSSS